MIRMRKLTYLCSLMTCSALPNALFASEFNPLNSRFSSPIENLFNLPAMSETQLLSSGQQRVQLKAEVVSSAVTMDQKSELVRFDGETWRLTPSWAMGFDGGWQITAEFPLMRHSSGFLDNSIDKWHEVFNFREGSRDDFPRNELVYGYQNGSTTDYLITDDEDGLGDLRLQVSKTLSEETPITLHLHIKAPTGDEDKLMGSGSWDVGISASYLKTALFEVESLAFAAEVGQHYLGDSDQVRNQKNYLTTLHTGVFWAVIPNVTLKAQLESHTKVSESELEPIESEALQTSLGVTWITESQHQWELAFTEDIKTDSTADVTFYLEWGIYF